MLLLSRCVDTSIAQGIERCPPEAGAAVRIRLDVFGIIRAALLVWQRRFDVYTAHCAAWRYNNVKKIMVGLWPEI